MLDFVRVSGATRLRTHLPPIDEGCEFYPLDSTPDAKPQEHSIEVRLDRAQRNLELLGNFPIVAALLGADR
jgi:hypothetical protein